MVLEIKHDIIDIMSTDGRPKMLRGLAKYYIDGNEVTKDVYEIAEKIVLNNFGSRETQYSPK
jgi:hypothetical protein